MFVHAGPGSSHLPGAGWELWCGTSRQHLVLLYAPVTDSSHALAGKQGRVGLHTWCGDTWSLCPKACGWGKMEPDSSQGWFEHILTLGKVSWFAAVSLPQRLWVQRKEVWAVVLSCSWSLSRLSVGSSDLLPESCLSVMLETQHSNSG